MAPKKRPLKEANEPNAKTAKVEEEEAGSSKKEKIDKLAELDDLDSQEMEEHAVPGMEMGNLMGMFQTSLVQKSENKRKRSEQLVNASVKLSSRKMDEIVHKQGDQRKKVQEQYQQQFESLINQWDGEIVKAKEMEDKLADTYRQQQKLYTTLRVTQSKIRSDVKTLCTQFHKTMEDMEKAHAIEQGDFVSELKRDVSMLHKKYLMDTHNAEMAKMKENMQKILTSSF